MDKKIDLTEILKNCPEGFELYTPLWGKVFFVSINENKNDKFPIVVRAEPFGTISFTKEGYFFYNVLDGECILFPSKYLRSWFRFSAPWYKKDRFDPTTLNHFDKVLVFILDKKQWVCSSFSHLVVIDGVYYAWVTAGWRYNFCIPYTDDTKHLVGTDNDAPEYYRYWED